MKPMADEKKGHIAALITITLWGLTFISSKVLLSEFKPVELLVIRFTIGLIAICIIHPQRIKGTTWKQELLFAGAGLSGVCLYYMLENIALTYTMASNVGVITSTAAFFSAIMVHLFAKESDERLSPSFFIGFIIAMAGVTLISFNGTRLELNPKGDLIAVVAAFTWGIYSVFIKKIDAYGYDTFSVTKRIFVYGIIFMLPFLFAEGIEVDLGRFSSVKVLLNLAFLSLGASAFCFLGWNYAVKCIGAVKTSVYIYLTPVVSVIASALVLSEPITLMSAGGTVLTLLGLVISELKSRRK